MAKATTTTAYRMTTGYAFELQGKVDGTHTGTWQDSSDEHWDTVVYNARANERFVGLRYIDGFSHCVFLCPDGVYRAQLRVRCM